jgi:pimeloyl-ACP methyl ester carboxylesterase
MKLTHRIHGYDITAHHHGPVDAPVVVLVHGMMEPANVWRSVVARLKSRYRCVVLEMPWNGQQGSLWGLDVRSEVWLAATLSSFDIRPDAWVAHSFGATTLLALLTATDRPGAQAPAVLVSPFYKASHEDVTWPLFENYVVRFTGFVEMSIKTRVKRELDPAVLRRMTEAARDAFGCYVWMHFWQLFSRMPFLPLGGLKQPILTLVGADDDSSPLADAQALSDALPNGALKVFPACGHFLLRRCEEASAAAIDRFLERCCPVKTATAQCA